MKKQPAEEHLESIDSENNANLKLNANAEIFWIKMKNVTVLENLSTNASLKRLILTKEK